MLEPETPLPWKAYRNFPNDGLTSGIESSHGEMVCEFGDLDEINPGGFKHADDATYAVYAANLLPKLVATLRILSGPTKLDPNLIAQEALELVETYRP